VRQGSTPEEARARQEGLQRLGTLAYQATQTSAQHTLGGQNSGKSRADKEAALLKRVRDVFHDNDFIVSGHWKKKALKLLSAAGEKGVTEAWLTDHRVQLRGVNATPKKLNRRSK
jgi:hypothetical protein